MSTSVKATLHETIDQLDEADCQRLWQLWQTQTIVIRSMQAVDFPAVSAIVIPGGTAAQSLSNTPNSASWLIDIRSF
jgi:hypothetical protein